MSTIKGIWRKQGRHSLEAEARCRSMDNDRPCISKPTPKEQYAHTRVGGRLGSSPRTFSRLPYSSCASVPRYFYGVEIVRFSTLFHRRVSHHIHLIARVPLERVYQVHHAFDVQIYNFKIIQSNVQQKILFPSICRQVVETLLRIISSLSSEPFCTVRSLFSSHYLDAGCVSCSDTWIPDTRYTTD